MQEGEGRGGGILRTHCLGPVEGEPRYPAGSTHSMAGHRVVVLRAGKFILLVSPEAEEVGGEETAFCAQESSTRLKRNGEAGHGRRCIRLQESGHTEGHKPFAR